MALQFSVAVRNAMAQAILPLLPGNFSQLHIFNGTMPATTAGAAPAVRIAFGILKLNWLANLGDGKLQIAVPVYGTQSGTSLINNATFFRLIANTGPLCHLQCTLNHPGVSWAGSASMIAGGALAVDVLSILMGNE